LTRLGAPGAGLAAEAVEIGGAGELLVDSGVACEAF